MPSLIGRISRYARSPQGRQLAGRAQRFAKSPEGKRKIADARRRLSKRP